MKTAGVYDFRLGHDDGARLIMGGADVIDSPANTAFANHFGDVNFLDPDLYPIEIEFHEATGDANLVLSYLPPGAGDYSVVPTADLYPVSSAPVAIDIKPGSDPNCFNVNGHGVIPVAILGSEGFDPVTIDDGSLNFGGFEVRMRGNKDPLCSVEDVNSDGIDDLVCQFEDDGSGDWDTSENAPATLTGMTLDGLAFEGGDSICVRP